MPHVTTTRPRRMLPTEVRFRQIMSDRGFRLVDDAWRGTGKGHPAICPLGHQCSPVPLNVNRGTAPCRKCPSGQTGAAEAAFRARVTDLGGVVTEAGWLGVAEPHRVVCAEGHEATPRPNDVGKGQGICRVCAGATWDAFYVVRSPEIVKFGITSGDPRVRLGVHRRDGISDVVRLFTELPGRLARDLEDGLKIRLKGSGWSPVRGSEYFPADALPDVLDVVDGRLAGLRA